MPVPGPLQTVQRAEFWGVILAPQAFLPGHLGVDNLNVVRTTFPLLDHGCLSKPLPLVKDGDLKYCCSAFYSGPGLGYG